VAALPYPAYGFGAVFCRVTALPYPAYGFGAVLPGGGFALPGLA